MPAKDTISKHLLKRIVVDLARYLLRIEIEAIDIVETEQQRVEDRRADLVVLARQGKRELLLHVEIQNANDARMPARMLRYLSDLLLARPGLLVRQCLIYIGREPLRMPDGINQEGLTYRYDLVDMHRVDCSLFLERDDPNALVIAILCDFKGRDERAVVHEILERLHRLTQDSPQRFRDYLLMLEVLSTNRDLQDHVRREEEMLRVEIEKLPSYGIGLQDGILKGVEQGIERGAHANALAMLTRLIEHRFGPLDDATRRRLADASTEQLMDWSQRLLSAATLADVLDPSRGECR